MHSRVVQRYHRQIITVLVVLLIISAFYLYNNQKKLTELTKTKSNVLKDSSNKENPNLSSSTKSTVESTESSSDIKPRILSAQDTVVRVGDFVKNRLRVPSGKSLTFYTYSNKDMISKSVSTYGTWEGGFNNMVNSFLVANADTHLLDIGSNIGIYTMVAVSLGRKAIALDANIHNLFRLKQTLIENKAEHLVTLVHNALNDKRGKVYMKIYPDNVGGSAISENYHSTINDTKVDSILFNDLVSIVPFKKGIMKLDLETREYNALLHADDLFDKVDIIGVMMEWSIPRFQDPQVRGSYVKSFFEKRGYKAYRTFSDQSALNEDFMKWPGDIVWIKK